MNLQRIERAVPKGRLFGRWKWFSQSLSALSSASASSASPIRADESPPLKSSRTGACIEKGGRENHSLIDAIKAGGAEGIEHFDSEIAQLVQDRDRRSRDRTRVCHQSLSSGAGTGEVAGAARAFPSTVV